MNSIPFENQHEKKRFLKKKKSIKKVCGQDVTFVGEVCFELPSHVPESEEKNRKKKQLKNGMVYGHLLLT